MFHHPYNTKVYIDGFNLYYSMKERGWRRYYWLDVCKLSVKLIQKAKSLDYIDRDSQIASVRYYTSRVADIGDDIRKSARQNTYLEALSAHNDLINGNLTISYGQYQLKPFVCHHCKRDISFPVEKMTDVNLATDLLMDAVYDSYSVAIVVSGDSDLKAPVQAVKEMFPKKRVIVAMPVDRWSSELATSSFRFVKLEERQYQQSQLPESLRRTDGFQIKRPKLWM